jgi:AcrR family transcriptional regulator
MAPNLDDPRVRKTRRGLQEAFVRLILRQGYDSVSIQDIATEAETARVTFYRHYRDKEELLTDCLNVLYEALAVKIERLSREGLLQGNTPTLALYEHIQEQEALYRILFSSRGTHTALKQVRHHLAQHALHALHEWAQSRSVVLNVIPPEIIAYHGASAQIGLAIWWLDHDKPYPAAYMARVSVWLSLCGILGAIGVDNFKPPLPPYPG